MRIIRPILFVILCILAFTGRVAGQGSADYAGGLKVKLNEDGSKYFRLLTWHQMWATSSQLGGQDAPDLEMNFTLRRSRFLMYAQLNERFLILTHFGLNSLTPATMGALSAADDRGSVPTEGRGFNGSFFMHDAWVEYTILPKYLYLGGGLHYWNGVSRLTNQSTLNFMTLDAPLTNWFSLGTSDQFARHLGFYAKGKLGQLDYRLALNQATTRPLFRGAASETDPYTQYANFSDPGGGMVTQGYLTYQFLDQESNLLPFFVGSYLGTKRVFNLGAGFYHHARGTSTIDPVRMDTTVNSASSLGVDAFLDMPLGEGGAKGAVTAYLAYYHHDWGENYSGGLRFAGTGNAFYGKLGYLLPKFSEKVRVQPYVAATHASLDAWKERENSSAIDLKVGTNFYLDGHHSKITLEYYMSNAYTPGSGMGVITQTPRDELAGMVRMQLMIYL